MENEEKRVSVNAFERAAKKQATAPVKEQWLGVEVTIRRTLPLMDMLQFVKDITESCFLKDGTYIPEMFEPTVRSGILTYYANFRLPENVEKQYELICGTDAVEMVRRHINNSQLNDIVEAACKRIEYLCDTDILALRDKMNMMLEAFQSVGEKMSGMFAGVDPEDLCALVDSIGVGGVNEEKIVSAYLDRMHGGEMAEGAQAGEQRKADAQ